MNSSPQPNEAASQEAASDNSKSVALTTPSSVKVWSFVGGRRTASANGSPAAKAERASWLSRKAAATIMILSLVVTLAVIFVPGLWKETVQREAYLPELETMARQSPEDGRLLALLGVRFAQAKEFPQATVTLQRAAASGATDASVWLTMAASYAATGDAAHAMAALRLNAHDSSLAPTMEAAQQRCRALKKSASPAELANAICPGGFDPVVDVYGAGSILNGIAEWRGRRDPEHSGFATRERWAREQPRDAAVKVLWGKALMTNRRLAEAEKTLSRALEIAPRSLEANLAMADLRYETGIYGAALVQYRKCLDIEPTCVPALVKGGQAAIEQKLRTLPVEWLEKATKLAPQSADAWIGLGRAYFNQGLRHDKALQAYQTAHRLAPERTDYFHRYAEMLRVNYRFDEAIALLRRRLVAEPSDAQCHYLLAIHLLDYKQSAATTKEAEQLLRRSTTLAPEVSAPQIRLGQLLLEQDQPKEAIPFLQRGLAMDPYSLNASTVLARAYRRVGNVTEARVAARNAEGLGAYLKMRESLEEKERQVPEDSKTHQQLAELYAAGKEMDKARRQMQMLYLLKHRPEEARKGIRALHDASSIGVGIDSRPTSQGEQPRDKLPTPATSIKR